MQEILYQKYFYNYTIINLGHKVTIMWDPMVLYTDNTGILKTKLSDKNCG